MRLRTGWLMLALMPLTSPAVAGDRTWIEAGLVAGRGVADRDTGFEQYELLAARGLPWSWRLHEGWALHTRLNMTAGALRGDGGAGFIGAVGPSLVLQGAGAGISIEGGILATVISQHEFEQKDLGGPFQFTSHVGIAFALGRHLGVGYHFQHMSNADIYDQNPGLDLHALELRYRF
jgi:lipid A 3-O-deacylase PagL